MNVKRRTNEHLAQGYACRWRAYLKKLSNLKPDRWPPYSYTNAYGKTRSGDQKLQKPQKLIHFNQSLLTQTHTHIQEAESGDQPVWFNGLSQPGDDSTCE